MHSSAKCTGTLCGLRGFNVQSGGATANVQQSVVEERPIGDMPGSAGRAVPNWYIQSVALLREYP